MNGKEVDATFDKIYESKIAPQLSNLENYRVQEKKKFDFLIIVLIVSVIGLCLFIFLACRHILPPQVLIVGLALSSILLAISMILSKKVREDFRKKLKLALLPHLFSAFGNFSILNKEVLSLKEIKALGLYPRAARKIDDDAISGIYKDIPVTLMETQIYHYEKKKEKGSSDIKDFNGLILKIKLNKTFDGILVAEQKIRIDNYINMIKAFAQKEPEMCPPNVIQFLDNPLFKSISQAQSFMQEHKLYLQDGKLNIDVFDLHTKNRVTRKLDKILLEDRDFNENYNIYSDDQVAARYILTPTFMEKIKNVQMVMLMLSLDFVCKDGYLYFFLGNCIVSLIDSMQQNSNSCSDGFFEVGDISNSLLNKELYRKTFKELVAIFSLINYFKLDQKIGL